MNIRDVGESVDQISPAEGGRSSRTGESFDTGMNKHSDNAGEASREEPCCCCAMWGPGGRFRIGLLIAMAVVVTAILVWGFSTAG